MMKSIRNIFLAFGLLCVTLPGIVEAKGASSTSKIKQAIIKESISGYPGNCPCPYNTARNGSKCGKRSAWSRDGGYSPICYEKEVTSQMIESWKKRNK